jgi:hypothetical protein
VTFGHGQSGLLLIGDEHTVRRLPVYKGDVNAVRRGKSAAGSLRPDRDTSGWHRFPMRRVPGADCAVDET